MTLEGLNFAASTGPTAQQPRADVSASAPAGDSNNPSTPLSLTVEEVLVTDGVVNIRDSTNNTVTAVNKINVNATVQVAGEVVTVPSARLALTIADSAPLTLTARGLAFDKKERSLSFADVSLASNFGSLTAQGAVNLSGHSFSDQGIADLRDTVTITSREIALDALATALAPFSASLHSMKPSGSLSLSVKVRNPTAPTPRLQGVVTLKNVGITPHPSAVLTEAQGELALSGTPLALDISTERVALRYQGTPLSIALTTLLRDSKALEIRRCAVNGWGGKAMLAGTVSAPNERPVRIELTANDIAASGLLATFKPEVSGQISGTVSSFSATFATSTPTNNVMAALEGAGSLRMRDGVIKGTNIAAAVVGKLDSLTFLAGTLRSFVPTNFRIYLEKPDTEVKDVRADFSLHQGIISLSSFALTSDIFSLDGSGTIALNGDLNLTTTIYFTKDFSQALAQQGRDIKRILASDGRLIIPLTIQGRSPALIFYPNLSKIIETGAAKEIQEKALSALDKALGGKNREPGKESIKRPSNLGKALRGLGL
jgi:hypothetical protein